MLSTTKHVSDLVLLDTEQGALSADKTGLSSKYGKETRTIVPAQMHFVGSVSDTGELSTL